MKKRFRARLLDGGHAFQALRKRSRYAASLMRRPQNVHLRGALQLLLALPLPALAMPVLTTTMVGCGGAVQSSRLRDSIDDVSFDESRRRYLELAPEDPSRVALREQLLLHLASRTDAVLLAADYDSVVSHLADMTALLAPLDFEEGRALPPELRPLAEFVAAHGTRRGDEARVLAAHLILARLGRDDRTTHEREYERVSAWGREAREPTGEDIIAIVEGGVGLVHVWEEHARLTPTPDVLSRLSGMYLHLRDAVAGTTTQEGFRPPRSLGDMEHLEMAAAVMQRAPLEAAAVYLARGDLAGARTRLSGESPRGEDRRIVAALEEADRTDPAPLFELANVFMEARPDVALGLCRLGVRRFPTDARFPLCLARVASATGVLGDSADYYVRAIDLAPADLDVYDEALDTLRTMIDRGAFESARDIGEVRIAGHASTLIIAQRLERFPSAESPPLDTARLELALARAELSRGRASEATRHFEASIFATRNERVDVLVSIRARLELGRLALRLGSSAHATELAIDGLEITPQDNASDTARARFESLIGDASRVGGNAAEATAHYQRALALLEGVDAESGAVSERAAREVLHGILLRRLGDNARSADAFRGALALAPDADLAAEILQHLATNAPDGALADEVLRRARMGAQLTDAWKVYLALWTESVHVMAHEPADAEVRHLLESDAARSGWHAQLAALALGRRSLSDTLEAAEHDGERCQAEFHEAMRLLRADQRTEARAALERVIATGMVGHDEYSVAVDLLTQLQP